MTEHLPLKITIGQKYDPAITMTEQADADTYFERCVEHNMRCAANEGVKRDRAEAEQIERANLGYYAGYHGSETRERVERLFACAHPVFGKIAERGRPTPEEALLAGVRMGRESLR